jgi:DNA polymerase-3 subunit epsilon
MLDEGEYVVLDTETSSLDGEVLEIAVIDAAGFVLLNTLVKPSPYCVISSGAMKVHGITHEMLADAPRWGSVAKHLSGIVQDKPVVIYNADFDVQIIRNTDTAHGLKSIKYTTRGAWCAMKYCAEYIGEWNNAKGSWRWHSLGSVADRFGIQTPNAHRALGDCQTTLAVLQHIQAHWKQIVSLNQ